MKCYRLLGFLVLLVGILAACGPAEPEAAIVGVVNPFGIEMPIEGFKAGLADLDYVEGEDVNYVNADMSGGMAALESAVEDLMQKDVDLILCVTTPACQTAQKVTDGTDVAVLFVAVTDPVTAGLVEDFSDPGGNVTGIVSAAKGAVNEGRALEWLLQVAPDIEQVFVPYNPDDPVTLTKLGAVQDAAAKLGVELILQEVQSSDAAATIPSSIPENADALLTFSERVFNVSIVQELAAAAIERDLPCLAPGVEYGALLSYAPTLSAIGRQAARLADQIVRGSSPADLPVETPEFFLTINLETADAIGLDIPDEVLRQADDIIR